MQGNGDKSVELYFQGENFSKRVKFIFFFNEDAVDSSMNVSFGC